MSIQDSDEGDDLKMLQLKFIDWGNEEDVPLSVVRLDPAAVYSLS